MGDIDTILHKLRTVCGLGKAELLQRGPAAEARPMNHRSPGLMEQLMRWAGSDPKRWGKLHTALLRIYAPRWECTDARDTLVAWVAAWMALTRAEADVTRLRSRRPPLKESERNAKLGRQADVNFWGRLVERLEFSASEALLVDDEAARILGAFLSEKGGSTEPSADSLNGAPECT